MGTGSVHRGGIALRRSTVEPSGRDGRADPAAASGQGRARGVGGAAIVLPTPQAWCPPVGQPAGAAHRVRSFPGAHQRRGGHRDAGDAGESGVARRIARQPPPAGRHLPVFSRRAHAAGRERRHESHEPWRRIDRLAGGTDVPGNRHAAFGDGTPPRGATLAAEGRPCRACRASKGSRNARGRRHARPRRRHRAAVDRRSRLHHVRLQRTVSRSAAVGDARSA